MRSKCTSLLPRTTLHSDSKQFVSVFCVFRTVFFVHIWVPGRRESSWSSISFQESCMISSSTVMPIYTAIWVRVKGTLAWDFCFNWFSQRNPVRTLINHLRYFLFGFKFAKIFALCILHILSTCTNLFRAFSVYEKIHYTYSQFK